MLFFVLSVLAALLAAVRVCLGTIAPITFAQTPLHWQVAGKGQNYLVGFWKKSMPKQRAPPGVGQFENTDKMAVKPEKKAAAALI
jgi:hypothetical protein